ncbi:unnamed protein product [Allacma fusca]|uniref:Uncharacterized protein n=1 Tax=Allacma fusca TaxID=39272 RepID=A0A8J2L1D0_9HEXA|nr:unnamed protein product [Allacma fusca]
MTEKDRKKNEMYHILFSEREGASRRIQIYRNLCHCHQLDVEGYYRKTPMLFLNDYHTLEPFLRIFSQQV